MADIRNYYYCHSTAKSYNISGFAATGRESKMKNYDAGRKVFLQVVLALSILLTGISSGVAGAVDSESAKTNLPAVKAETINEWNLAVKNLSNATIGRDEQAKALHFNKLKELAIKEKPLLLFKSTVTRIDVEPVTKQMVLDIYGGIKRDANDNDLNYFINEMTPEVFSKQQDKTTRAMLLHKLATTGMLLEKRKKFQDGTREELISSLRNSVTDDKEEMEVRAVAIADLARFKDKAAGNYAKKILDDEGVDSNTPLACCSLEALAVLRDKTAIPQMINILQNTRSERKFGVCAFALARIGGDEATEALVEAVDRYEGRHVRSALWYRRAEYRDIINGNANGNILLALRAAAICHPQGVEERLIQLLHSDDAGIREQAKLTAREYLPNDRLGAELEQTVSAKKEIVAEPESETIINENIPPVPPLKFVLPPKQNDGGAR
jgi:hypothetical protein